VLEEAFGLLEIDHMDWMIRQKLLLALIEKHNGGPVGIETMAATLSEDIGTLKKSLSLSYADRILKRTPRGREATEKAYHHLHKPLKNPHSRKS